MKMHVELLGVMYEVTRNGVELEFDRVNTYDGFTFNLVTNKFSDVENVSTTIMETLVKGVMSLTSFQLD